MEDYKLLVTEFMTEGFVDDYPYHKECLDKLNNELQQSNIPFQYTYDGYCLDLLNRFLTVIETYFATEETVEIFFNTYNEIVINTLDDMKNCQVEQQT